MRRSLGVTLSAVAAILGSVLSLLFAALMVLSGIVAPPTAEMTTLVRAGIFIVAAVFAGFAVWGAATAIGLFRLRPWARWSVLVFSGILVFFNGTGAVMIAIMPFPAPPGDDVRIMGAVKLGIAVFYGLLALLGGFWLYFFNRAGIKAQFSGAGAAASGRPPALITVIAVFLMMGAAPVLVFVFFPFPMVLFGTVLTGWVSRAFCLVFGSFQLWTAIGLMRRKAFSVRLAYGLFAFGMLNGIAAIAVPGALRRALAMMADYLPSLHQQSGYDPFASIPFGVALGVILNAALAWLLHRRRGEFTAAAR